MNGKGCLAAILKLFRIDLTRCATAGQPFPYRQRDDFLSQAELSFYRVLSTTLDSSFVICPKVNLGDLFFVAGSTRTQSYRNKIDRKHVDFLLCAASTLKPVLGIELDDSSHARRDRVDRDIFVDRVFDAAQLPLLHVRAAASYSPVQLSELIGKALHQQAPNPVMPASTSGVPICPKCGAAMVRRTASKGERKGKEFWGCRNYPKCRETQEA